MKDMFCMTAGPTGVHEDVLTALAQRATNPDVDPAFFEFYGQLCHDLQRLLKTNEDVLVLCGEGILGLEAACASLTERGTRVLAISNGVFGAGFADFAAMYGAEVVVFEQEDKAPIDVMALREFLESDSDFAYATLVHCETPTGTLNDLSTICPMLSEFGVLSVVDAVSSIGGTEIRTDDWKIDLLLGASQKCLSAPPGLTFLTMSKRAWKRIEERETPVAGYYSNLAPWKEWKEKQWFPYTMPTNFLQALYRAVQRCLEDENRLERHQRIAKATRFALMEAGLSLYANEGHSPTVSCFLLPKALKAKKVLELLRKDHSLLLSGPIGNLDEGLIRIGHMGENCRPHLVWHALRCLDETLRKLNHGSQSKLHELFTNALDDNEV